MTLPTHVWLFALAALTVSASFAMPTKPLQRILQVKGFLANPKQLFGPQAENFWGGPSTWDSVTDRVRGGISTATITTSYDHATFSGLLDTSTLGGAGFASVRTNLTTTDFSAYSGLQITFDKADGRTYALNLYNELGGRREDGRRESSIEFKYNIQTLASNDIQIFEAPFDAFV
ncbi:hypothetical protein HDU79_006144, partial [Rhizoclosmatium sp. JEL0117]